MNLVLKAITDFNFNRPFQPELLNLVTKLDKLSNFITTFLLKFAQASNLYLYPSDSEMAIAALLSFSAQTQ